MPLEHGATHGQVEVDSEVGECGGGGMRGKTEEGGFPSCRCGLAYGVMKTEWGLSLLVTDTMCRQWEWLADVAWHEVCVSK